MLSFKLPASVCSSARASGEEREREEWGREGERKRQTERKERRRGREGGKEGERKREGEREILTYSFTLPFFTKLLLGLP